MTTIEECFKSQQLVLSNLEKDHADKCNRISELESVLASFLGEDDKIDVMLGGNPNYVNSFMEHARTLLYGEKEEEHQNEV